MAVTAEELNIIIQARDEKFHKQMKRNEEVIRRFSNQGSRQLDRFGRAYTNMGRSVGSQRAALQNASFQVQDIITQISMGTSPMRALSVQLPQLLGGFGAMGAAVGVAVGALGMLGPALSQGEEDVEGYAKAMEKLAMDTVNAADQLAMLEAGLSTIAELKAEQQLAELAERRLELEERLAGAKGRNRRGIEFQIDALDKETSLILENLQKYRETVAALRSKQKQIETNKKITEATKEVTEELASAASRIDFSTAIEGAQQLASELRVSLHQAMQILRLVGAATQAANDAANPVHDPRDPRYTESTSRLGRLRDMMNSGELNRGIPAAQSSGAARTAGGGSASQKEDVLSTLLKEVALNEQLLGVSEAREQVMRRLGDDAADYSETEIAGVIARIEAYENEAAALKDIQAQQQSIADTIEGSMTDAFTSIVDGTKSTEEAFKDMARTVIAQLYRILIVQRLVGSFDPATGQGSGLAGAIMSAFKGKASGGSVMAGQAYRVGEHGPEPFIPAQNGRILSVAQAKGAIGGGGHNVTQNISFTADVKQTVRAELQSFAPKLIEATVSAVSDKSRRSPAYKSAL